MVFKLCKECGKECWHNLLKKNKDGQGGERCTYCAFPLGTGPKRDVHSALNTQQMAKVRVR